MAPTDCFNERICRALTTLGLFHEVHNGTIAVDRTSMVRASPRTQETEAYGCVIDLIKDLCPEAAWVGWLGRTDDYLCIATYVNN